MENKRICIEISGCPRLFKQGYQSLKEFGLLDLPNVDIFIDTWKYEVDKEQPDFDLTGGWRYKDEGSLDEYIELFKPVKYTINKYDVQLDYKLNLLQDKLTKGNIRDGHVKRLLCMTKSITGANTLRQMHEHKENIKYDYVIRARSDLEFQGKFVPETLGLIQPKTMLVDQYGASLTTAGDAFAIGTGEDMDIYCSLNKKIQDYFNLDVEINTEILLPRLLKDNNINHLTTYFVKSVFRPKFWNV